MHEVRSLVWDRIDGQRSVEDVIAAVLERYQGNAAEGRPSVVELISSLRDAGVVEISLHGGRSETHERLACVPGSFQRVINAVKHLHAQGIKVILKCPVTRDNQEEVLDMYALAQELAATIVFDPVITPRDD